MSKRKRSRDDFADEIQAHLELEADALKQDGLSDEEAHRRAKVAFGNVLAARERFHLLGRVEWLDNVLRDIRFAIRQLTHNPGFAATAIFVLALGFGASISIFDLVDTALIKPLPYRDPGRLVSVFETVESCPLCNVSYQNFRDWQRMAHSFVSIDVWGYARYTVQSASGTESADGARVSDGFFRTLGLKPVLGRDFHAGEDKPGAAHTVLLSYGAWQKRFNRDPEVVGKTIQLDDLTYTIIGVLPGSFHFAPRGEADFWTALNDPTGCDKRRGCHGLFGLARLKDGVSVSAASSEMESIADRLAAQYPDSNRGYGATTVSLAEVSVGDLRPVLLALFSAAALLLLIACVNVTGLLLLRSEGRQHEIAVRKALGATALRLVAQFTAEAVLIAAAGTCLGLGFAWAALGLIPHLIPQQRIEAMPFLLNLGINKHVAVFTAVSTLAATLLFVLAPIMRLKRSSVRHDLAESGRAAAGQAWKKLGSKLVVIELATAVVLLAGAGLLGKSLYRLLHVETGFRPDHLSSVVVEVPKSYITDAQVMALEKALLNRAQSIPGAISVGLTVSKPIRAWDLGTNIHVPDSAQPDKRHDVPERDVSSGYLAMLGARLVRGRYFTEDEDDPAKPNIVVINETLAKEFFPGEDPVGKRIAYAPRGDAMQVIGVVDDIKEGQMDTPNRAVIYRPFNQNSWHSFELVVRSSQAPGAILPLLVNAVHDVNKGIATSNAATMDEVIQDSSAAYLRRISAWLVGGFAALAMALSIVGLYGVIAYSVAQRAKEIGVRMALGAQRRSIYGLVLRQAGWLTAVGLAVGVAGSIGASVLIRNLLFGVKFWDAMNLVSVIVLLALASVTASFVPAHRAASVNPAEALRAE
ncbi:MAG TPA: ABC transporter permease [Terracidiphilus sp.]|nr:ABC transporter permease [Terracidiphilus sp.]